VVFGDDRPVRAGRSHFGGGLGPVTDELSAGGSSTYVVARFA